MESGAAGASRSVSPSIGQLSVYGDEGMPPYGEPDAPAVTADSRGVQDHRCDLFQASAALAFRQGAEPQLCLRGAVKLQQLLLASQACQVHPDLRCPCHETHALPARRRPRKGLALQQMIAAKRQHQAEQQHLNPLLLQHAGQTAAPVGSSQPQSSAGASPEASGEDLAVVNPLYSNTSGYSTSGSLFEGECQLCVPFPK